MTCVYCGCLLPHGAMFCGECGRRVSPEGAGVTRPAAPRASANPLPAAAVARADAVPRQPKEGAPLMADEEPLVSEGVPLAAPAAAEIFSLQFSTGESVTVTGSGLIGRNPWPEPGETFGQLVRVFDTGRSVSKTHLEFGQDAGNLWISDRFSGNGTVLTIAGEQPRRCEPGKRIRVPRGARVILGEQFFDVS